MRLVAGLGNSLMVVVALALPVAAAAQDPGAGGRGMGQGMGGGQGLMGLASGRSLMGEVTEVEAGHLTVHSFLGETYLVHVGVNTKFVKGPAGMGRGNGAGRRDDGQQRGMGGQGGMGGGFQPVEIKASEIKKGDTVDVMGEIDPAKKEAGAVVVALVDPVRAQAMKERLAGYGKTWVMGKVTVIEGVKLTLLSPIDSQTRVIVADENTTLRKRRDPITLADIQVGDTVQAEGSAKAGAFAATTIQVMGMPQGGQGRMPRDPAASGQQPQ